MKTLYDAEADALYVRFSDADVSESEEVRPGIVFDFDEAGKIVAIEVLDAKNNVAGSVADLVTAAA